MQIHYDLTPATQGTLPTLHPSLWTEQVADTHAKEPVLLRTLLRTPEG